MNDTPDPEPMPLDDVRDLARIAMFAALVAAGAFFHVPFGPMHISLQTMMIMLAGFILGPKKAAVALLLYVLCGFLGLPVFGRGRAGPASFLGPTAGYYPGFVLGAFIAGLSCRFSGTRRRHVAGMIGFGAAGIVAILGLGAVGVRVTMGVSWDQALVMGMYAFLPGDLVKMLAAVLVRLSFFPAAPGGGPGAPGHA